MWLLYIFLCHSLLLHLHECSWLHSKLPFHMHAVVFFFFTRCLVQVTTWLDLNKWLMLNGRIMVNCGGTSGVTQVDPKSSTNSSSWVQNSTIKALSIAFLGQVGLYLIYYFIWFQFLLSNRFYSLTHI